MCSAWHRERRSLAKPEFICFFFWTVLTENIAFKNSSVFFYKFALIWGDMVGVQLMRKGVLAVSPVKSISSTALNAEPSWSVISILTESPSFEGTKTFLFWLAVTVTIKWQINITNITILAVLRCPGINQYYHFSCFKMPWNKSILPF